MLGKKTVLWGIIIIIGLGMARNLVSAWSGEVNSERSSEASAQVNALVPVSVFFVDQAVTDLSQGWSAMSQEKQAAFLGIYDPSNTGDIDEAYVAQVLANYQKIRQTLSSEIEVAYAPSSDNCEGQRMYFTDMTKLYVCPYFFEETNELRKARTLIHEVAHIALLSTDRAYYRPTSKQYAQLTPNGSPLTELPVVGPILREVLRSDTLFHPDAYAHFALQNAGYTNIYAPAEQQLH